jgi:hypothetical protein
VSLAKKITANVSVGHLFQLLGFLAIRQHNVRDVRYPFDQICNRLLYFERGALTRLRARIMRGALRLPVGVLAVLARAYASAKGIDLNSKRAGKVISGQV